MWREQVRRTRIARSLADSCGSALIVGTGIFVVAWCGRTRTGHDRPDGGVVVGPRRVAAATAGEVGCAEASLLRSGQEERSRPRAAHHPRTRLEGLGKTLAAPFGLRPTAARSSWRSG